MGRYGAEETLFFEDGLAFGLGDDVRGGLSGKDEELVNGGGIVREDSSP